MKPIDPFWKAILPLCCVLLIDAMSWGIVIPSLGPLLLDPSQSMLPIDTSRHVRNLIFSSALGLPMLFLFLGAPLLGDISDNIGRKGALLIALFGIAASCLLSAVGVMIGSVTLLLVGRCILGFMDSSEGIAKAAMSDISSDQHKVINMSLMSLCGTIGFVIAPVLGGFITNKELYPYFNYVTPFFVAAGFALLNAILLFFLFHETYIPKVKKRFHILKSMQNLISAFTDTRIKRLSIIFFCSQFAWGGYFQTISILLIEQYHHTSQQVGIFLTYLALCFAVTLSVIIRMLINRFEYQTIAAMGLFFITLGIGLIAFPVSERTVWLSVMPTTFGVGISYNTLLTLFSDAVDKENQGRVMGIATALFAMGWVLSSVISGFLSAVNIHLPYVVLSAVALIGFLFSLFEMKRKERSLKRSSG